MGNMMRTNHNHKLLSRFWRFFMPRPPEISNAAQLQLKGHSGLNGREIVTLSTQDWNDLWTRKQRFMLQFARQGNRVLYVETQYHWVTYIRQFPKQWRRFYLFLLGPREVEPNLYVLTPPILLPAFQVFPFIAKINNFVLSIFLKATLRKVEFDRPILWLYSHFNHSLIKTLGCQKALYECVDEFSGARGLVRADVARAQEIDTLRSVDLAIVTAPSLKSSKENYNRNIFVVPNATNVAHFTMANTISQPEPRDLSQIPRPRLIFVGGIAYWVDLALLRFIAVNRPNWNIVMVGPVITRTNEFKGLDNIYLLGRKPYAEVPNYLASCDIALNPYKVDSVAENCSPLKLYEYLASGLPIVSTDMPEARRFGDLVTVADSYRSFLESCDDILQWTCEQKDRRRQRARAEVGNHSWENRFRQVDKIAQEALA
jgi:glycosyltransferase involved in cell wall biosynthesis